MTQHSFWQQEIAHVTYAISCDLHVAAIALISWGLAASFVCCYQAACRGRAPWSAPYFCCSLFPREPWTGATSKLAIRAVFAGAR